MGHPLSGPLVFLATKVFSTLSSRSCRPTAGEGEGFQSSLPNALWHRIACSLCRTSFGGDVYQAVKTPTVMWDRELQGSAMSAVEYHWLYRHDTDGAVAGLTYAHMAHIERCPVEGQTLLAAAWQASSAGCEGDAKQHLRFSTSHDGGKTWCVRACVEPHSSATLTSAAWISPDDSLTHCYSAGHRPRV